jgi:PAS domain S-box-containing protein
MEHPTSERIAALTAELESARRCNRQLIDAMPCGFMQLEPIRDGDHRPVDFRILAVNPAAGSLTGRDETGLMGKTLREAFPGLDPRWIETMGRVQENGDTVRFEGYLTAPGRIFRGAAFSPAADRIEIAFSRPIDSTGPEKGAGRALTEARQRAAETDALLTASHAILVHKVFEEAARAVFDACKGLIGATAGYVALLNESGEENEVLFLDAGDRPCDVDPELPMPIRGLRSVAYRDRAPAYDNDFHNSHWMDFMPPGHVRLDNVLFAPLILDQKAVGLIGLANKPVGFTDHDARMAQAFGGLAAVALKNSQDLEERLRAEKRLKSSKTLLELTLNSLRSAALLIDTQEHVILECNRAATEIFGYEREELVGRIPIFLHVDPAARKTFLAQLRPAMAETGRFELTDFRMKRKDGTIFPTEHQVMPFRDEESGRTGWLSIIQDVSERRRLEEQLRQSQKMEAIGTLAGGIAHDFNNILFPILGYTEMLMEDVGEDREIRESLSEILRATHRAKDLVNQILAFSRKSGRELKPLNIEGAVREAVKTVRSMLPAAIGIEQHIQPCDPVLGDGSQIHQVIMNLCTNAYHAMRNRGGVLTVSLEPVDAGGIDPATFPGIQPGPHVRLSVRDTGTGMAPEVERLIFDPYFTTKGPGEGTGLGLSVVSGIVKDHKGAILVETEPGTGSAFHIYLPVIPAMSADTKPGSPGPAPGGTESILVVDDEPQVVQMMHLLLESLGYRVTSRYSSLDALAAFSASPARYDLIVSDMTMPALSGLALAGKVRALRADIPIILCTGFSEQMSREALKAAGVARTLLKPVTKTDLAATVREVLDAAHPFS